LSVQSQKPKTVACNGWTNVVNVEMTVTNSIARANLGLDVTVYILDNINFVGHLLGGDKGLRTDSAVIGHMKWTKKNYFGG
jgi:hypothetical protein